MIHWSGWSSNKPHFRYRMQQRWQQDSGGKEMWRNPKTPKSPHPVLPLKRNASLICRMVKQTCFHTVNKFCKYANFLWSRHLGRERRPISCQWNHKQYIAKWLGPSTGENCGWGRSSRTFRCRHSTVNTTPASRKLRAVSRCRCDQPFPLSVRKNWAKKTPVLRTVSHHSTEDCRLKQDPQKNSKRLDLKLCPIMFSIRRHKHTYGNIHKNFSESEINGVLAKKKYSKIYFR